MHNGGAEIFLRELTKYLTKVKIRQSICLRPHNISTAFTSTFPFPVRAGGRKEIHDAIGEGDILLCWGRIHLNDVITTKPEVCIFNACVDEPEQYLNCDRFVTHVIASNSKVQQQVPPSLRSTLILPGVNPDRLNVTVTKEKMRADLGLKPDDFVVGMIARIDYQKRQGLLVECARRMPHIKALFVGDGPDQKKLQAVAPSNCIFVGHQTDGLGNWFNCLDTYCLLSSTEGCPAALFEAMFMGVPVIATNVGSVPDLIQHGDNGLIVDTPESLDKAIQSLIDNPLLGVGLGGAGQNMAYKVGHIKHTAQRWEELIVRLDEGRKCKLFI